MDNVEGSGLLETAFSFKARHCQIRMTENKTEPSVANVQP